jgi:hypothetical protein
MTERTRVEKSKSFKFKCHFHEVSYEGLEGDVDPALDNLLMSPPRRPEPQQVGKDHAGSRYFQLVFQMV